MPPEWLKKRGYRHLDTPVGESFAKKAVNPAFVAKHAFLPLIHYMKTEKRYKKSAATGGRAITTKERPIKYASHRDACILSYYAWKLDALLGKHYAGAGINESVIAYRSLGLSNYDFAAEAYSFAVKNSPVMILAFDVTGFFDNLDHALLKRRLKSILGVSELPEDWFKVFRFITQFHYVQREDLRSHPVFGPRLKERTRDRIASMDELKAEAIPIHANPEIAKGAKRGIPQGTPISAAASNLYMIEFDAAANAACDAVGALYRRYSDDILVVCKPTDAATLEAALLNLIKAEKLEVASHKTERTLFDKGAAISGTSKAAQYLGFTLDEGGPGIRENSISRQWRKMRRAMKRTKKVAVAKISAGHSDRPFTKRLYRRFTHIKVNDGNSIRALRNFSSYARRSAKAFGVPTRIPNQVKRLEKAALQELAALKTLAKPKPPTSVP